MTRFRSNLLAGILGSVALVALPVPSLAQSAGAKIAVDVAKAAGTAGEQADGFLGVVNGKASAGVQSAIAEINAGRAEVYQATAARTGVTPQAAGEATARQLFARVPPGQFIRPVGQGWTRK